MTDKQEPVGYIFDWKNTDNKNKVVEGWFTTSKEFIKKHYGFNIRALYTTPPQREWVGLTDEEVSEIIRKEIGFNSCWGPEESFAHAIEAKLKEKNG